MEKSKWKRFDYVVNIETPGEKPIYAAVLAAVDIFSLVCNKLND